MLRGLAAVGVLVGHVRSFVVLDYSSAPAHAIWVKLFYGFTGLGHQSVIAFFALSGFLVGGPALRAILDGKWSWRRYMLRRVTRLWVVLIPALLLTLALDTAGRVMGGRAGYEGAFYHLINSGPDLASPADLSATTLLGNLLFLQTIVTPVLGSDGPLWSLANEFWYYIMFPFLLVALIWRPWRLGSALMGAVGVAVIILLPTGMVLLGLIWVAGAIAHYGLRLIRRVVTLKCGAIWFLLSLVAVAGSAIADKWSPGISSDIFLGLAFACMLPSLTLLPNLGAMYQGVADFLAKLSYTLYATHFPVLAFIWFAALAPQKWPVGLEAATFMGSLVMTAFIVALGMWWLFERNTDRVRMTLERFVLGPAAGQVT
jgi:peptidoglycan/LPS O-acetylase OafA/YrhL